MKSLVGVSRMDRGIGMKIRVKCLYRKGVIADRTDQRLLRWFGQVERINEWIPMDKMVLMSEVECG